MMKLLLLIAALLPQSPEVTVALYEHPPYVVRDVNEPTGVLADRWKEIASQNGIQSRYIWFPDANTARNAVHTGGASYVLDPKHAAAEYKIIKAEMDPADLLICLTMVFAILLFPLWDWIAKRRQLDASTLRNGRWVTGAIAATIMIAGVAIGMQHQEEFREDPAKISLLDRAILTTSGRNFLIRTGVDTQLSVYALRSPFPNAQR